MCSVVSQIYKFTLYLLYRIRIWTLWTIVIIEFSLLRERFQSASLNLMLFAQKKSV